MTIESVFVFQLMKTPQKHFYQQNLPDYVKELKRCLKFAS